MALVLAVAGLAAASVAPRVSARAAAWLSQTKVRGRVLAVQLTAPAPAPSLARSAVPAVTPDTSPGGLGRLDPGWRFNMVGAVVTAARPGQRLPAIAVRTSLGDGHWSAWQRLSFEAEPGGLRSIADPLWVGEGRLLEYRGTGGSAAVAFSFVNSLGDATAGDRLTAAARSVVAAVAGFVRPTAAQAATSAPQIVSRQQWGADETWRRGEPDYARVKMAFIHHTVSGNTYTQAQSPAVVRAVYYYHTHSCGFRDIGYNFLIDRYGTIYEGRYGGVTRGPIGAQTLGFNTGSTGIALMGDFRTAPPPAKAIAALEALLAWKLDVHHIDPLSKVRMICGSSDKFTAGQTVTFNAISGHRDACYTTCPGDALYAKLPAVRAVAAATGLPKIYGFVPSSGAISPNGDGVLDALTVSFTLSETADWKVDVGDAAGNVVREFSGNGAAETVKWDGRDAAGALVPDGTYTLTGTASSAKGAATPATATVVVDTQAPRFATYATGAATVNPEGTGAGDRCVLSYTLSEACSVQVVVKSSGGAAVYQLQPWTFLAPAGRSVAWDGKVTAAAGRVPVAEGTYTLAATAKDAAGNVGSASATVVVDRTVRVSARQPLYCSPNGDRVQDTAAVTYVLLRPAAATAKVVQTGRVLASMPLGNRPAGTSTLTWQGTGGSGTRLPGGRYTIELTAVTATGGARAACVTVIDLVRPTLTATRSTTVRGLKASAAQYTVRDAYSVGAHVRAIVRTAVGTLVKRVDLGWVSTGVAHRFVFTPTRTGVYLVTFSAVDLAGNRQVAPAVWRLTVTK
jgi:flagellar hook assembly protein FlgD